MGDVTQFVPGLLAALLFGVLTGPWAARRLHVGRALGWATMTALGAILATTMRPDFGIPDPGTGPGICVLARFGPAPLADLTTVSEASLNVVLFVPLGIALGLLPRSRTKALAIAGAVVLPVAIETVQYVVPALGRYCDSADVADNLTGLAVGLVMGLVARAVAGGATAHRNRREAAAPERRDA